jgi:hypothetical protein
MCVEAQTLSFLDTHSMQSKRRFRLHCYTFNIQESIPKEHRTALPEASSVLCMATTQSSAEVSEAPLGDAWGTPRGAPARLGDDARSTGSQASRATSDTGTYAETVHPLSFACSRHKKCDQSLGTCCHAQALLRRPPQMAT